MKKKILLSILCICMVLTMMPTVGYAAAPPVGDLYVNGVLIYSSDTTKTANPDGVVGVSFDAETSTLKLSGANITNARNGRGISVSFPLTINLEGTNTISIAPGKGSNGIKASSTLTIQGGGEPYNRQ